MNSHASISEPGPAATETASPVKAAGEQGRAAVGLRVAVGTTIFLSAFLLFQVQPLISKAILPWFGGTAGVWTICVLLFQVLLLAGYTLAHAGLNWVRPVPWLSVQFVLLLVAMALLPIVPNPAWRPGVTATPEPQIVRIVLGSVGLQFLLLATTAPLLQAWWARAFPGRSPYRLYALSNTGSLLALMTYPFVFEVYWPVTRQAMAWSAGFVVYAALFAISLSGLIRRAAAVSSPRGGAAADNGLAPAGSPPGFGDVARWFVLAAIPSAMLIATTNQVCLDIASVPFLWVLPLGLYLLSFVLCFDSERWSLPWLWTAAVAVTSIGMWIGLLWDASLPIILQIVVFFAGLFAAAMLCHGALARARPAPRFLTGFYLALSAGGAAGGICVGLLAPLVFPNYWEMQACILASLLTAVALNFPRRRQAPRFRWRVAGWVSLAIVLVGVAIGMAVDMRQDAKHAIVTLRNFYGVLRVKEYDRGRRDHSIVLLNGRITHGDQFVNSPLRQVPTTYYSPASGIGQVLRHVRGDQPLQVGVVGLGVGTLAAYAEAGDEFHFYEINPAVEAIARNVFWYLTESRGKVEIHLGDARLLLEQANAADAPPLDVLAIDAFSGDAIPTHLLTREALQVYLQRLKPNGVLCLHISNRHFDLGRVVAALAPELSCAAILVNNKSDTATSTNSATWVILTREPDRLAELNLRNTKPLQSSPQVRWTDDYCNPFGVLRPFAP